MSEAPRLFRVVLEVRSIEQAREFYSELLGIEGRLVSKERLYFDCGPVILALVEVTGPKRRPIAEYLYLAVRNLDSIHGRASELACLARGKVHEDDAGEIHTRPWGERSFYCHDPFGNGLCFVDERTVFTGR
jgi:catechol 2,3-dioxygenase-like lactoylglutathione lyase family enzyme